MAAENQSHDKVRGMESRLEDREMIFTRLFDAPREVVFKAWTDPKQLARWWGPHDFTNPVSEADPRPGGRYRIVMRGPDGAEYPTTGSYLEVVPPERLVFTDEFAGMPADFLNSLREARGGNVDPAKLKIVVTVLFEDQDGKTRLTVRSRFDDNIDRDAIVKLGAIDGWAQSFERLDLVVASP